MKGRYLINLLRRDGRLSWPKWLVTYWDGVPARSLRCVKFALKIPNRLGKKCQKTSGGGGDFFDSHCSSFLLHLHTLRSFSAWVLAIFSLSVVFSVYRYLSCCWVYSCVVVVVAPDFFIVHSFMIISTYFCQYLCWFCFCLFVMLNCLFKLFYWCGMMLCALCSPFKKKLLTQWTSTLQLLSVTCYCHCYWF